MFARSGGTSTHPPSQNSFRRVWRGATPRVCSDFCLPTRNRPRAFPLGKAERPSPGVPAPPGTAPCTASELRSDVWRWCAPLSETDPVSPHPRVVDRPLTGPCTPAPIGPTPRPKAADQNGPRSCGRSHPAQHAGAAQIPGEPGRPPSYRPARSLESIIASNETHGPHRRHQAPHVTVSRYSFRLKP